MVITMRKTNFIKLFFICILFYSCSDDSNLTIEPDEELSITLKAGFNNGYFEWDQVNKISVKNQFNTSNTYLELPWRGGASDASGIPANWIDQNAYDSNFKNRKYSRENGWVLVYSNINEYVANKYFALYNKNTGILRFFFYALSSSSGQGSTVSFWGIRVNNETSLLNYTDSYAFGANKKKVAPSYVTTPVGSIDSNSRFVSQGYKENTWYGLEIECAYDPNIIGKNSYFDINAWSANKISMQGTFDGQGKIDGSITNVGSNSSINVSLSNLLNSSINKTNSIKVGADNVANVVGEKIDNDKESGFFKSIWNNIKKNASQWITSGLESGAKQGLSTILSSGGSVAANAFKGLVNSFIGGNSPTTSKVDLDLKFNGNFTIEGETILNGWGTIQSLPIPGSSTNSNYVPYYNTPLGVWALDKTPILTIRRYMTSSNIREKNRTDIFYGLEASKILLNPALQSDFSVANVKQELLFPALFEERFGSIISKNSGSTEKALLSLKPYDVTLGYSVYALGLISYNPSGILSRVSFELVNKKTKEKIYFSKVFNVDVRVDVDVTTYLNDNSGEGKD